MIEVKSPDGRTLTAASWGGVRDRPVFLLHGTPGSRLGQAPRGLVLAQLGVRLITFDRPGYGRSDPKPGRLVADAAADVEAIADHLGLDRFGVVGRSGGGPHALACAALLPHRVTRTAALVSLAPMDAEDLDWFAGMSEGNVRTYRTSDRSPRQLAPKLEQQARDIRLNPSQHLESLRRELTQADRRAVRDTALRTMLRRNFAEAVRLNSSGWRDDALAFRRPWGFDVAAIQGEVLLWHGLDDVFSPVEHTEWLSRHIPKAQTVLAPDAAHFDAMRVLPDVLAWIADDAPWAA